MIDYDFDTPNVELAEAVFEVADDCDTSGHRFRIKLGDIDIDLSPYLRSAIKARFPDIAEADLDQYIEQYKQEQENEKRERRAEREHLQSLIKEKINGQAQIGWELAYKLCSGLTDDKSKKLRYKLIFRLSSLTLQAKSDICKQYLASIKEDAENPEIINVYRTLAKLSTQRDHEENATAISDETSKYLECWFSLSSDQISTAKEIMGFCRRNKYEDELEVWKRRYADLCLVGGSPETLSRELISILLSLNRVEQVKSIISQVDSKQFTPDLFYDLISLKEYDVAESILDRMANDAQNEHISDYPSHQLGWIESQKYRMKYYRSGYSFHSHWTPIYYYDYCSSDEINTGRRIDHLKQKYHEAFTIHRRCLTDIELYNQTPAAMRDKLLHTYIEACEQELLVIPQILAYIEEYGEILSNSGTDTNQTYNIPKLKIEDKFKFANCEVFQKLAIYYEKAALYNDALRVCDAAISCGYLDDGTKMGILGRKDRIIKKKERKEQIK